MNKKKTIIISGGMGGIGQAIAKQLAADGHSINILFYKTDQVAVDNFLATLPKPGDHAAYECDVTNSEAVKSTVSQIQERTAGVDVCIHAAVSPLVRRRISLIEEANFRQQFEVTVFGALNLFQAVVTYMKKNQSGSIIGITTAALEPGSPPTTMAGYMCAKHALRGILREFYNDLSTNNISVNAVAPNFVDTPLHNDLPQQVLEAMRRKGDLPSTTPDAVAEVFSYLCTPEAGSISGRNFVVGDTEVHFL